MEPDARQQRWQQRQQHRQVHRLRLTRLGLACILCLLVAAAYRYFRARDNAMWLRPIRLSRIAPTPRLPTNPVQAKIVESARAQLGTFYSAQYFVLPYPNGDPPRDRGACTDVVIRSLRAAGYDLQRLIHEDMRRHFEKYPHKWGLQKPDRNIDHRRVPNQRRFFERHGLTLTCEVSPRTLSQWQPGDIVCWKLNNNLDHTGVLSDTSNAQGIPFVIHNGGLCVEQDCLTAARIIGHYRFPKRS